ncbi:hypothetical protein ACVWWG_007652 [Bradyrhizobium sp. LB7.2]
MAERYQDRPFPSDDYDRGGDQHGRAESGDPLAELARLIGQTDPFAAQGRPGAHPPAAPAQGYQDHDYRQDDYQQDHAEQASPPPGPPSWMRRANVQPAPPPEPAYPVSGTPVHPLHRYSAQPTAPEPDFHQPQAHQDPAYQDQAYQAQAYQDQAYQQPDQAYREQAYQQPDPARYDDALYGRLEAGEQDYQRDPAYPDDPLRVPERLSRGGSRRAEKAARRHDDGRGDPGACRGRDRRCLRLQDLCGLAPQRGAADHQGRQHADQGRAGAVGFFGESAGPHGHRRWHREDRAARGSAC